MNAIVKQLEQGLIVSCQALEGEPLYGSHYMAAMALAAQAGGAKGIRVNTAQDIKAIKKVCSLPVIGIVKRHYPGYDVYITSTMAEVCEVIEAGADIVAVDATIRPRPDGSSVKELLNRIRDRFQIPVMADGSNLEEGIEAARAGFDLVSTTLAGYHTAP